MCSRRYRTGRPAARKSVAARADVERRRPSDGPPDADGDLRDLLIESRESPQWDEVASRCLTCGNCTMVCPTCFCTSTEDVSDLTGEHAERWLHWASCYRVRFHLRPRWRQRPPVRRITVPALVDPQTGHLARPVRHVGLRRLRAMHRLVSHRYRHHRRNEQDGRR